MSLVLAAFFFQINACKEPVITDKTLLGENEELLLGTADTFQVNSFLLRESDVVTSSVAGGILGSITDPVLGTTYAGFYANFRTTTNNINFGDNLQLDSCVLVLKYRGKYGNNTQAANLSVYELDQDIQIRNDYYNNSSFAVKVPPVAQLFNFVPNTTDTVHVYGQSYAPQLRIRLNNDFGNKILHADTLHLMNSSAFLSFMKGLKVAVQPGSQGNGMVSLDLYAAESSIELYYRNSASDSLVYLFPISSGGQTVNHFEHTFGSVVNQYLNNSETESDDELPVLSGGGTKIKITIPEIDSIASNIAINKAEIIIPISALYSSYDSIYTPPVSIALYRIDNAGKAVNDISYLGGKLETVVIDGETVKRYRINITHYAQKLIKKIYQNNGFMLAAPDANGQRCIISNKANDKNQKIVFKIIYTKL